MDLIISLKSPSNYFAKHYVYDWIFDFQMYNPDIKTNNFEINMWFKISGMEFK